MRSLLITLSFICFASVLCQNYRSIECPIAGNPDPSTVDQATCESYTACEWFDDYCSMRSNSEAGYSVTSSQTDTGNGFIVELTKNYDNVTLYGQDISVLNLEVVYHGDTQVQIKIYDPANPRYEVPKNLNLLNTQGTAPLYEVLVSENGNLNIDIQRVSTGELVFESHGPLSFEDQFIQLTTALLSPYLYGIGEHSRTQLRHTFNPRTTYPIFARDESMKDDDMANHYGSHPYYVSMEDDSGNTHSVLFYSSNAMEYSMFEMGDGTPAITMRSIGGIIDLHFFLGPNPEDVNNQYAECVGMPTFPPYWSFGFHLSRFGYNTSAEYQEVRDRMRDANIPQDGQFFDIDYMDVRKIFTYNPVTWPDLPQVIDDLHLENIHVALILDPAPPIEDGFSPFENGKSMDVFVSWPPGEVPADQPSNAADYVVGYVWPEEKVVFPDFMKQDTTTWWDNEITSMYQDLLLNFDGLWIDMNEPANFGTDTDRPFNYPESEPDWSLKCPNNSYNDPPYPTLAATQIYSESGRINDKTICMSSVHDMNGTEYRHYDVHSLYGFYEARSTFIALEDLFFGERPFILTRSTFPGVGRFTLHWLGDNYSTWQSLRQSIVGMLEFNMFAFPMVGADVCGFFEDVSEELCIRWTQAGAFYPYCRNHNYISATPQDPANPAWSDSTDIFRDVILLRYKYIPFFYARFHRVHMNGQSAVRPIFNVFPTDLTARDIDTQFFWGEGMMVAPVMDEGASSRNVYFPQGLYYNLVDGTLAAEGPTTILVYAPIEFIPVYVRGGAILPYQQPSVTTVESRLNPMGFTVALSETLDAEGEIFWDDGYQEHTMDETYLGEIYYANNNLTLLPTHNASAADGVMLGQIDFYGFTYNPSTVTMNGQDLDSSSWSYSSVTQVLNLFISVPINQYLEILLA